MEKNQKPLDITAQQVIENMVEGIMITDADHVIQSVNPLFTHVTGYSPEEAIGQKPNLLKSGRHKSSYYRKMRETLDKFGNWEGEIFNRRKNGEIYLEHLTISAIKDQSGRVTHYMGVFQDITKKKRAEELIRQMAYYDSLTGLPNRAHFRESLHQALDNAKRNNEKLGVLFIDLDRVKLINDSLGHDMGDELLKSVAERFKTCMKPGDTVARLGGDEFMILIPNLQQAEDARGMSEKILEVLKPPFRLDEQDIYITGSVGISIYPDDGVDSDTLLKNADTAMYRAKRLGRDTFQFFNNEMKTEVNNQLALGNALRRALERNEFVVHYQPQIEISSGDIIGMEALVRWNHPEKGLIPPTSFIPWAEDSGLIVPLGELVLKMACTQAVRWLEKGFMPLKLAVNLSARQFKESDLLQTITDILKQTGMPAENLELELTESMLLELAGPSHRITHALRSMGIGISIDDFGTGYSSLSYLKKLPVNTIKMDQSFVKDLTTDPNDAAIATAVIGLGHGLDLAVLAEGVENEGQLNFLRKLKCDRIQGFVFSKPVPPEAFERYFLSQKVDHAIIDSKN